MRYMCNGYEQWYTLKAVSREKEDVFNILLSITFMVHLPGNQGQDSMWVLRGWEGYAMTFLPFLP